MMPVDPAIEPVSTLDLPPDLSFAASEESGHRKLEITALRATLWTIVAYGVTQSIRLGNNIILTRLLLPQDFGLMALASTLVLGMTLLSDVGLLPSVIGSPQGDEPIFLNTAWTIQIIRGFALWILALLLAFPLAALYGDRRIRLLLPVLALSMLLGGFASSNLLRAARHIGVRRLLVIDLLAQIVGIIVMVLWALRSPSVWALVSGSLVAAAAKTVMSHIPAVMPGEKSSLAWDRSCVSSLVRFGKWILFGTAFYFLGSQADRLIFGKMITFAALGIYNIAFTVADIPRQIITQFCNRIGYPFVAKMVHLPRPEFRKKVLRYRFYVLCAGGVVLSIVILAGGPLVLRVYDARYAAASWMVPILALGLWHTLMYSTAGDILFSLGKSIYNAIGTGCFCVTMFVALPIALHYGGMRAGVICVAAGDVPFYIVLGIGSAREKVSLWRQDALATLIFLCLLAVGFALRRLFV